MPHTYALKYRPAGFATLPKGWRDPAPHKDFQFGTVVYDDALSPAEVDSFELVEIPTEARVAQLVDLCVERFREYAADHVEMASGDPNYFVAAVGHWLSRHPVHVERQPFAENVLARLKTLLTLG